MGSRCSKIQDVFYVELRMKRSSQDEYEEVESPFAPKASEKQSQRRESLRTRKNVFNRPFATDSTNAPTYIENIGTRRSIGHPDQIDFINKRQSAISDREIEYLEDVEEEEVEEEELVKTPTRSASSSAKKKQKVKTNLLTKTAWSVIGLLVLRLICMDRGVWDYFSTESVIQEKNQELMSIRAENKDIKTEITRIQLDRNFQRQLAKEHLGVIAADEFLILFAGESSESSSSETVNNTL